MHYFYRIHGLIMKVNFMIFYLDEIKDESIINNENVDFASLAEDVMGRKDIKDE